MSDTAERLHRRIGRSGYCSRRAAEELIQQGRVTVNGAVVTELGTKVEPSDVVAVDGAPLVSPRLLSLVMNKPRGVVTTLSDPQKRPTVAKYLPKTDQVLKPVGRLDMDSEGALLFTNDGDLAFRLTHPRYGVVKSYVAIVHGRLSESAIRRLEKGIRLDDGMTAPARIQILSSGQSERRTKVMIEIHEGRNRQVRRMFEAVGHPVLELERVRFGPIATTGLKAGECRMLGRAEHNRLREMVGLEPLPSEKRTRDPEA